MNIINAANRLNAMPQIVERAAASDFDDFIKLMEDAEKNAAWTASMLTKKVKKLTVGGKAFYEVELDHGDGYIFRAENNLTDYVVRYAKSPVLMGTKYEAFKQAKVWRSSETLLSSDRVVPAVFFKVLLPRFGIMATDEQQTDQGKRMWFQFIRKVLTSTWHVYYIDTEELVKDNDYKPVEITTAEQLKSLASTIWGLSKAHMGRVCVISKKPL